MRQAGVLLLVVVLSYGSGPRLAHAQSPASSPDSAPSGAERFFAQPGSPFLVDPDAVTPADVDPSATVHGTSPIDDSMVFWHVLFEQLEGRTNLDDTELRWEGRGWVGTDENRLVVKTEGFLNEHGKVDDGDQELLYARPIWFLRYFDWQAGVRYDWDSSPGRVWGALGIEGLAPAFFHVGATLYVSDAGHVAGRLEGSYDLLITNRLIVQPQVELNLYSKDDPQRAVGDGLSEIDTGLRLRYELSRKFAPYVGVAYNGKFGQTATFVREEGGLVDDVRFVFGVRVWL